MRRRAARVGQHAQPVRAVGEHVLYRLARIVRHCKRLHQQVADREAALRIDQIERALLVGIVRRFAQGGERTVRQPHRDAEAARQRKYAFAVVGVLVRDDYSGEIGSLEADASQARHGFAQRKPAVEHKTRACNLDHERVAQAAATKRSEAHAWFLTSAERSEAHETAEGYFSCCCSRERILRAVSEESGLPSLLRTCTSLESLRSFTNTRYCSAFGSGAERQNISLARKLSFFLSSASACGST